MFQAIKKIPTGDCIDAKVHHQHRPLLYLPLQMNQLINQTHSYDFTITTSN
jgi:hypothetical protein